MKVLILDEFGSSVSLISVKEVEFGGDLEFIRYTSMYCIVERFLTFVPLDTRAFSETNFENHKFQLWNESGEHQYGNKRTHTHARSHANTRTQRAYM